MLVWNRIAETLRTGEPCALVSVASALGSTPRENGARMIVLSDGSFRGTIGGGTLEFEAIRWAVEALRAGKAGLDLRKVSLGPDLGQCCGGRIDVAIEVLQPDQLADVVALADKEEGGDVFATEAVVRPGKSLQRRILAVPADTRFYLEVDGTLRETFGSDRRSIYLFGAGHVGKAIVLALAPLPFEITWLDSRPEAFPGAVPGNVRKALLDRSDNSIVACLENAPAGAFVLAMTHSHGLDEEIMAASLAQQRFAYCGVIGSATKRARFEKRLKKRGLAQAIVGTMVCPIGRPEIRSKHPAAIAAGIAADLLERDEAVIQKIAENGRKAERGTAFQSG
jgi:xanthine dehydrogenase accessory factor